MILSGTAAGDREAGVPLPRAHPAAAPRLHTLRTIVRPVGARPVSAPAPSPARHHGKRSKLQSLGPGQKTLAAPLGSLPRRVGHEAPRRRRVSAGEGGEAGAAGGGVILSVKKGPQHEGGVRDEGGAPAAAPRRVRRQRRHGVDSEDGGTAHHGLAVVETFQHTGHEGLKEALFVDAGEEAQGGAPQPLVRAA